MGILKKVRDNKTGTVHDLGDSRVDAFETELSGAAHNVPYSPAVLGKANAIEKKIDDHAANVANPHGVTKEQLGLANVENKSSTQIRSEITKENVTNALGYTPIDENRIGAANGVASLDAGGRIPASQIPGGFDNIDEYDSLADFPETGEEGKIYVAKDTNLTYRWTGTQYIEISPSLALGETATTAYRGDRGKTAYDHSQVSGDSTIHHTHANKELLDSYKQTEADLANAVARVHEHGNKAVLDGITADKVTEWDGKQDRLAAGRDIEITSSNAINSRSTAWTNFKFNGITTTADEAIVIATLAFGSMATTRIITTDLLTSYAWGLDITVHVTNNGACRVLYTNRTSHKDALVVGRKDSRIYICIKGNLASSAAHNIVSVFTSTFLDTVNPSTAYTKVNISDLSTDNVTVDRPATKAELEAQGNVILTYGQTPTQTYEELVEIQKQGKLYFMSGNEIALAYYSNVDQLIAIFVYAESHAVRKLRKNLTWNQYTNTFQQKLTFDDAPTAGSTNPLTSSGIKTALDAESTARSDADTALGSRISTLEGKTKLSDFTDNITTGTYSETGSSPVNGQAVASAVGTEATARSDADAALGGRIDTVDARGLTVKEIDGEQVLCFE